MSVTYRGTGRILAVDSAGGHILPVIAIPRWSRTVREVQANLECLIGIPIVVIDIFDSRDAIGFVFAESLHGRQPPASRGFRSVDLEALQEGEVSAVQKRAILSLINRRPSRGPFFRTGWLEDAVDWVRSVTGEAHGSFEIVQSNASAFTALARISFAGSTYWLKAVAPELNQEYRFTKKLVRLFPRFLPSIVSYRDDWHALLMRSGGATLGPAHQTTLGTLGIVGRSLAQLQIASIDHVEELLTLGFTDIRVRTLRIQMRSALPLLEQAMSLQDFAGIPCFSRRKLNEICIEVVRLYNFLDELGLPDTLLHNDLHTHNVLVENRQCMFIDWAHPAIGNPLLTYNQLRSELLHRPRLHARLSATYQAVLKQIISPHQMSRALALLPAFAAAAELQQCLLRAHTSLLNGHRFARQIRSLVRYLDRALRVDATDYRRRSA